VGNCFCKPLLVLALFCTCDTFCRLGGKSSSRQQTGLFAGGLMLISPFGRIAAAVIAALIRKKLFKSLGQVLGSCKNGIDRGGTQLERLVIPGGSFAAMLFIDFGLLRSLKYCFLKHIDVELKKTVAICAGTNG